MLVALPCQRLQIILGAKYVVPVGADDVVVNRISTDTRTIQAGDTFVALSGEHFDGHEYVAMAVNRGANAVIVAREMPNILVPQLVVEDTRLALRDLAAFQREHYKGKVIAITGSNGKTTTKEMIKSILSIGFEVAATKGNLNNELGVPFTVFDWEATDAFAIVEMGANHVGEIAYLTEMVSPDIAVITNVSEAHIEGFGSLATIAEAKAEIYDGLVARKGIAVVNVDDAFSEQWLEKTQELKQVCFARQTRSQARKHQPNVFVNKADASGYCEMEFDNGEVIEVNLPVGGLHNVDNALASATVTYALGVDVDVIAQGLATFEPAQGRLQTHTLQLDNTTVTMIDDTYNANPASLRAGVNTLQGQKECLRVLMLGDMGELGEQADDVHLDLGEALIGQLDAVFCVGKLSRFFAEGALSVDQTQHGKQRKPIAHYDSKLTLIEEAEQFLSAQTVPVKVLVKGSRSAKMEQVVNGLIQKMTKTT